MAPETVLAVRTNGEGDHSIYRLRITTADGDGPLNGFDPPLSAIDFSFKVECSTDFDCVSGDDRSPAPWESPPIDYLARDFASFRRLILDRLAVTMPDWRERNPADVGVTLVEVLAYVGDQLAYYQDAVATEAYLGTARRRTSIRRHARLLDYPMHDGCNARAWIAVEVEDGVRNVTLPREYSPGRPTQLLSRVAGRPPLVPERELEAILAEAAPLVFEAMHDARLFDSHNEIRFHTWGDEECALPRGATRATLIDDEAARLLLVPGDVLIFEETRGPATGQPADADPTRRHAVRLTRVSPAAAVAADGTRTPGPLTRDELLDRPIVEIEWAEDDALPFPLCVSTRLSNHGTGVVVQDVSVARGNVVLADHGRTIAADPLPAPIPDRPYRPVLADREITHRVPFEGAAWTAPTSTGDSARAAIHQDPRRALPAIRLYDGVDSWSPVRDLLACDRFEPAFVVETENDGRAMLRFGDDRYGRMPPEGLPLEPVYRVGGGVAGNVGADAITHIVTTPGLGVTAVRNPLPAVGGTAPEPLEKVRVDAPEAFRRQERAVTAEDYAEIAERHPEVSRAVARRRWTGSWHTIFVAIDRRGGRPVDDAFEREMVEWISHYALAAHDVEIEPPRFAPLDIALRVCVEPGFLRGNVHRALLDVFSQHDLPDGRRGFFHPDRWSFGQTVYLSRIIAAAMEVPGVRWVAVDPDADPPGRFRRWGETGRDEIESGRIDIGPFEIARLDNDPNARENGKIEFHMEGGV